jgi:hypothetical protein
MKTKAKFLGQDIKGNHSSESAVIQHSNKFKHQNRSFIYRSLKFREHFVLVQHTIEEHNFDIFTISETWLDSTVDSQAIQIPGFVFFRQDHGEHKSGCGLGVYIRDTFTATILKDVSKSATKMSNHSG